MLCLLGAQIHWGEADNDIYTRQGRDVQEPRPGCVRVACCFRRGGRGGSFLRGGALMSGGSVSGDSQPRGPWWAGSQGDVCAHA